MTGWGALGADTVLTCLGLVEVLIKLRVAHVAATDLVAADAAVTGFVVAGLPVVLLVGGWFAQAHAGVPTERVVAGLSVIDTLVAVGVGAAGLGKKAETAP